MPSLLGGDDLGQGKLALPQLLLQGRMLRGGDVSQRGVRQTPEHIEKRVAHFRGKPRSPETRRKISESLRGRGPNKGKVGPDHPSFKENPGYQAVHYRLREHHGHEMTECESCGSSKNLQWAFKGKNGGWSADRNDYEVLCTSCHLKKDRNDK